MFCKTHVPFSSKSKDRKKQGPIASLFQIELSGFLRQFFPPPWHHVKKGLSCAIDVGVWTAVPEGAKASKPVCASGRVCHGWEGQLLLVERPMCQCWGVLTFRVSIFLKTLPNECGCVMVIFLPGRREARGILVVGGGGNVPMSEEVFRCMGCLWPF